MLQGQTGSHFEPRAVPPPLPNKCDWEVDPSELDFSSSARIGKVASPRAFYSFRLYCHLSCIREDTEMLISKLASCVLGNSLFC